MSSKQPIPAKEKKEGTRSSSRLKNMKSTLTSANSSAKGKPAPTPKDKGAAFLSALLHEATTGTKEPASKAPKKKPNLTIKIPPPNLPYPRKESAKPKPTGVKTTTRVSTKAEKAKKETKSSDKVKRAGLSKTTRVEKKKSRTTTRAGPKVVVRYQAILKIHAESESEGEEEIPKTPPTPGFDENLVKDILEEFAKDNQAAVAAAVEERVSKKRKQSFDENELFLKPGRAPPKVRLVKKPRKS